MGREYGTAAAEKQTPRTEQVAGCIEAWFLFAGLVAVVFDRSARTAGLVLIGYWVVLRAVKILVGSRS